MFPGSEGPREGAGRDESRSHGLQSHEVARQPGQAEACPRHLPRDRTDRVGIASRLDELGQRLPEALRGHPARQEERQGNGLHHVPGGAETQSDLTDRRLRRELREEEEPVPDAAVRQRVRELMKGRRPRRPDLGADRGHHCQGPEIGLVAVMGDPADIAQDRPLAWVGRVEHEGERRDPHRGPVSRRHLPPRAGQRPVRSRREVSQGLERGRAHAGDRARPEPPREGRGNGLGRDLSRLQGLTGRQGELGVIR